MEKFQFVGIFKQKNYFSWQHCFVLTLPAGNSNVTHFNLIFSARFLIKSKEKYDQHLLFSRFLQEYLPKIKSYKLYGCETVLKHLTFDLTIRFCLVFGQLAKISSHE